ncbi:RpsU Ribosomal protein S21 [uncultured Caudovirales phage]|jgi:small subunit ribosomal protein S21|uniref:RpsU Ribosomal protein S21 n=1 Tax=uncultured Caudovirales phage TaxID=2100421 RepID=A0A6J5RJS3_9CAUD|nr:RpsU Ribosomal protein S21 [uncultured Caudovirales phage]CAB4193968.1 RpsU Ribosomal protein S21 [uncultured Caudovirales phage]
MIIIKCTGKRIDGALKEYRQKVDRTGQMKELKERREFEKPSVKNRKIKQRAQYKARYENT